MQTKEQQREHLSNIRRNIKSREFKQAELSDKLTNFITQKNAKSIFCYVSFGHEMSTHNIIKFAFSCGVKVFVPHTTGGVLYIRKLLNADNLQSDKYGNIASEALGESASTSEIDLCIVPMLGFNMACFRLGYGGGYYDKFLCGFSGIKAGIAFDEQRLDSIITEPHDIRLDMIFTPANTFLKEGL